MRPFGRRARHAGERRTQGPAHGATPQFELEAVGTQATAVQEPPLPEGAYVTDGASLFRVAHSIRDPRGGEVILELEDCRTLEVILCSASVVAELRLHMVRPGAAC
jgi:hypothetical protein